MYRGKRASGRKKREVTGDDYGFGSEHAEMIDWPWAASIEITYQFRKNDLNSISGQLVLHLK